MRLCHGERQTRIVEDPILARAASRRALMTGAAP